MLTYRIKYLLLISSIVLITSCAYYNIMFNAEEKYASGEKKIKESTGKEITAEMRKDFYDTINKCWKLLNIYGDSSAYSDDALLLIGKSHWQVEEYVKSERQLQQFVDRYPNSDLITEANLWLGKALEKLDRDDEAIQYLNLALSADEDDNINAQVYLSLGSVYFKKELYDNARDQLNNAIDASDDDDLSAAAQFLIAETYFNQEEYEVSAENFQQVKKYNTQIDFLFSAFMRKIDCHIEMDQYDLAIQLLEENSSDNRFLNNKSVIRAKIGDLYKFKGLYIEATEEYDDVLELYPKTKGSAIAAYGMGQLMEFAYSSLDSAKVLYQRVGKEYRQSELTELADERARILDQYQKIKGNITRDIEDLIKIQEQSTNEDSVETSDVAVEEDEDEDETQSNKRNTNNKAPAKKPTARTLASIETSLEKNRFAKAEFFLLTLVNYDSAITAYNKFIVLSEDSILVPKAHYALYYIYGYELDDSEKADSIKNVIIDIFPNSIYAKYFQGQDESELVDREEESPYKYLFLQGEALLSDGQYYDAIDLFTQIAVEDSGSEITQKARYANAWIYENELEDVPSAVHAYTIVAEEYPNTEIGKIAKNKIKIPPVEKAVSNDSTGTSQENTQDLTQPDSTDNGGEIQEWPAPAQVEQSINVKDQDQAKPDN